MRPEYILSLDGTPTPAIIGDYIEIRPNQSVRLRPVLAELLGNAAPDLSNSLYHALAFLQALPRAISNDIWLHCHQDGSLSIGYVSQHTGTIAEALTTGEYNPVKGILLYAFMKSYEDTNFPNTHRVQLRMLAWKNTCFRWGFPNLHGFVQEATGGLPSLSAVFVGDVYLSYVIMGPTFGWRARQSHDEDSGTWSCLPWSDGPRYIDVSADNLRHYVYCVDMHYPEGREAAWHVLKYINHIEL